MKESSFIVWHFVEHSKNIDEAITNSAVLRAASVLFDRLISVFVPK